MRLVAIGVAIGFMAASTAHAQMAPSDAFVKAQQAFNDGQFETAEREFTDIVRAHPDNILAQAGLGNTFFREEKFAQAVEPYKKVLAAEKSGAQLTRTQHRVVVDQLAMAYGISGHTADAKALLQQAVRSDPGYPLNYYNLACAAADENDKGSVLRNLDLAFQHRAQVIPGEKLPDPATDSSFQKYSGDPDFQAVARRFKN